MMSKSIFLTIRPINNLTGGIALLWLYIVSGILLAIFLLMLVPISVTATYDEDFKCLVKIGFVPITLYPPKPKKKKKKKPKSEGNKPKEEKPRGKKPSLIKEKGLSWLVDVIKKVADLAVGALKYFFRHIIIRKFMLSITIAGDDAADTAVKYGKLCAAVYPSVGIIAGAARCKKYGIDIAPDFGRGAKTEINMYLKARVLLLWLVTLVFKFGIKGLKLLLEIKEN